MTPRVFRLAVVPIAASATVLALSTVASAQSPGAEPQRDPDVVVVLYSDYEGQGDEKTVEYQPGCVTVENGPFLTRSAVNSTDHPAALFETPDCSGEQHMVLNPQTGEDVGPPTETASILFLE